MAPVLGILLMFGACESSNDGTDIVGGQDLVIPQDQGQPQDPGGVDPGADRPDTSPVDLGQPDNPPPADIPVDTTPQDIPGSDTPAQDTPVADVPAEDAPAQDTPVADVPAEDAPAQDTGTADTPLQDASGGDMPAADATPFECSGACDPAVNSLQCMPDGQTICFCNSDTGVWEPYLCGDVCAANGMVGDQCILGTDGYICDCDFDCTKPDLVAIQCDNGYYTPCTCGSADPCSWVGDNYCDADCAEDFPEDHFDDSADCTCEGACDPQEFSGFCDASQNPCTCDESGTKVSQDCDAYCADLAAIPSTDQRCEAFLGMAFCNCQDYTCDDPAKVANQCEAVVLTPCTCAAGDICGWVGNGYCDTPYCNELYPDQENFDDQAQDCQG